MQINIKGKHLDLGDSLRNTIESKVNSYVTKYFENAINANVSITKQRHLFEVEISVNEGTGTGVVLRSHGEHGDVYKGVEDALHKLDKQLRRYKTKIKNHSKRCSKEIIADMINSTHYTIAPHSLDEAQNYDNNPTIIAEQDHNLENLSVSDAVMKMDLSKVPFLIFINASTKKVNAIYYREDGNIAWVDTKVSK